MFVLGLKAGNLEFPGKQDGWKGGPGAATSVSISLSSQPGAEGCGRVGQQLAELGKL